MPLVSLADAPSSRADQAAAWGVHMFTASGAVVALAALLAIYAEDLARAAILMLAALAIDSVDGTLARRFRVAEVVPRLDGRRLDDIVDYLNYVIVPAFFLVAAGALLHWTIAALPVLASAYGFSQADAKTDDHFFLGFPSYWNVVAIYVWALTLSPTGATVLIVLLSALVFVPVKYVYPSRMPVLRRTTNVLAGIWLIALSLALAFPSWFGDWPAVKLTLLFPAWYLALSFYLGGLRRERPR